MVKIIEALIISVAAAYVTAPLSIRLAYRLGVIDKPKDARRVHKKPIPRFGGMSIFLGSMAAMLIPAGMNNNIKIAMLGGLLMYGLGVADDITDLKPIVKFSGQVLIATLVYVLGIRITFIGNYFVPAGSESHANVILSAGVAYIITVLWIVGITNAVNLMDGLDGLAAGSAAIMALSLAYIAYIHGTRLGSMPVCIALVALAGGCIGFLPYNFSPAKTFMGDGGALYLGYMIAVLSVISPLKRATIVGAIIPMLTLAVPIFDTLFAMLRRTLRHESIMSADKGHLHHHLMAAGFGQRRSVLIIYGIVGIMGEAAVLMSRELYKDAFILICIALLYLCIIIVPKRPKKNLKTIITQDMSQIEKENFVDYLNYERERRKQLKEIAAAQVDEEEKAAEKAAEEAAERTGRPDLTDRADRADRADHDEQPDRADRDDRNNQYDGADRDDRAASGSRDSEGYKARHAAASKTKAEAADPEAAADAEERYLDTEAAEEDYTYAEAAEDSYLYAAAAERTENDPASAGLSEKSLSPDAAKSDSAVKQEPELGLPKGEADLMMGLAASGADCRAGERRGGGLRRDEYAESELSPEEELDAYVKEYLEGLIARSPESDDDPAGETIMENDNNSSDEGAMDAEEVIIDNKGDGDLSVTDAEEDGEGNAV